MREQRWLWLAVASAMVIGGCGSPAAGGAARHLAVVAVENFWGSIAGQIGGDRVSVTSVVTDPNADPHEYEANSDDVRAFAHADYVIRNGAGYDTWAQQVLDANAASNRKVLTVATLLGKGDGDNPHFWYSPDYVNRVADQITADLTALDTGDAAYFAQQRASFAAALKPYHDAIASIRAHFLGQKVAATESIFVYLNDALGLDLISPPDFMRAVAEGTDPPVSSIATFQDQLRSREATVLVFNTQTVTPVTTNLKALAAAARPPIPTVGISETLQPTGATFADWQTAQLSALQNALASSATTH